MSPSQASETCASASSATSACVNSLCEWVQTVSRKRDGVRPSLSLRCSQAWLSASAGDTLTIIDHASPNSPSAISPQYEIIVVEITIASHAPAQDTTNSAPAWSATVPTSFAGVVAVSELCAFPVVLRQPRRANRPTDISYISAIAFPVAPAATLPQCGCRDGHRQQ
jgi:hypothetical protein